MNHLLYVGLVFDHIFKLQYLQFNLKFIYVDDNMMVVMLVNQIKNTLTHLCNSYCENEEFEFGDFGPWAQDQIMS